MCDELMNPEIFIFSVLLFLVGFAEMPGSFVIYQRHHHAFHLIILHI
jgi:hypothetical protein